MPAVWPFRGWWSRCAAERELAGGGAHPSHGHRLLASGTGATVNLTDYDDFSVLGGMNSTLEPIDADTISRARTDRDAPGPKDKTLKTIPGMTVVVDIVTGHKSVLNCLLRPILKARRQAVGTLKIPGRVMFVAVEKDNFAVLVTSADASARERWSAALDTHVRLQQAAGLRRAEQLLSAQRVDLIMLDSSLLGSTVAETLARLTVNAPDVRVLLMDKGTHDADRVAAIKVGVVGYCDYNALASTVFKAVTAIRNGEVWLPRALIAQLIDTFSSDALSGVENALSEEQRQSLCSLTAREFEVARLVHQSANNKVIARALNIAERTVKAHLSAIFKKLGVANRVCLALLFKEISR